MTHKIVSLVDYRGSSSSASSSLEDLRTIPVVVDNETEDSEIEFNRILQLSQPKRGLRNIAPSERVIDSDEDIDESNAMRKSSRPADRTFDPEYYSLPAVEDLKIHVEDDIVLEKFGVVHQFLDFVVIIKPNDGVMHLDFDAMLFNEDRNAIGKVFDIFGQVKSTMYTIRFNSSEEAKAQLTLGQTVFYAPDEDLLTRTVLADEMIRMKISDGHADSSDEADPEFSDDEAEAAYYGAKRANRRVSSASNDQDAFVPNRRRAPKRNRQGAPTDANRFCGPQRFSGGGGGRFFSPGPFSLGPNYNNGRGPPNGRKSFSRPT